MIISRAPYRVSFFGGGTDYPEWYKEHGGVFLSTTIDHYISIVIRRKPALDKHRYRVVWRELEDVHNVDNIQHPFVRAALQKREFKYGLDVVYFGELPHGSGLGSSSAFGAAFLTALNELQEKECTKFDLAKEVFYIEREMLGETVGIQDQMASAFGGFNFGRIEKHGYVSLETISQSQEQLNALNDNLLFVFTGLSRSASEVAKEQVQSFKQKELVLHRMHEIAYEAFTILRSGRNLDDFGKLLHESWQLKRSLSQSITTSTVEEIYEEAIRAGALGGKLLGAGGGGFMIFYVPTKSRMNKVKKALSRFSQVPFRMSSRGAHVIAATPQSYSDYYDKLWSQLEPRSE